MKNSIQQNLIDFYLEFKTKNNFYQDDFFYSFLGKWPNCNIDKVNKKTGKIPIDFTNKFYSKNWILSNEFVNNHKSEIQKNRLFPVQNWTNMHLYKTTIFSLKKTNGFIIEPLSIKDLDTFIKTINTSFNKEILNQKNALKLVQNHNFTCFVGKLNNKIISTVVLYNNQQNIGLYFITTNKNFQKKGYATQTVCTGLNFLIKKDFKNFVLHATESGKKLYQNLGFITENKMRIFVKI